MFTLTHINTLPAAYSEKNFGDSVSMAQKDGYGLGMIL